ncbi:MAG: TonB-dependent receptor, partial [Acidobacteriota bacterium]|nr:TonB-dependent receptor [Acidobacteriota bacterium]
MLRHKKLTALPTHALGWALMAALLLGPIPAQAQFGTTGQVLGNVTGEGGTPVEGATVTLEHTGIDQPRTATTDAEGFYNFTDLPPADYRLSVKMDGYSVPAVVELTVRVGSTQRHDYALELATEISSEITVIGEAALVETVDSQVNEYISLEEIQNLPLQNRTFLDVLKILPGVNTGIVGGGLEGNGPANSISVHGARMNQNLFLIDGASNNDLSDLNADDLASVEVRNGPRTSAGTGQAGATFQTGTAMQSFNVDAIQEVQVATSLVSAEYGNASGAVINVITRSGTDQVHASATIQRQSDSLVESGSTAAGVQRSAQEFTRDQFSLTVGGPIKPGKTHYFVTYENDDHELGYDFNESPVVTFPGLAGLGITANHTKRDRLTGKLTHQLSDANTLTLSTFYNDERADIMNSIFRSGPEFLIPEHYTNESLGITLRHVAQVGPTFTLESLVSSTQADRVFVSDLDNPRRLRLFPSDGSVRPAGATIFHAEGTNSPDNDNKIESFEINERLSWVRGDHSLRAGAGWTEFKQRSVQEQFTSLSYGFVDDFNGPIPSNAFYLPPTDLSVSVTTFYAFVQDDWFKNDRWTLNLGARYDHNDLVGEDTFEPRVGFALDPKGDGRSVVRFGAGIYHDRTNLIGHVGALRPLALFGPVDPVTFVAVSTTPQNERVVDPGLKLPEITKVVLGYERQVGASGSVGFHAFYSDSKDLFFTDTDNRRLFELDGGRPDPTRGQITIYSNSGFTEVLDLEVQYRHTFGNGSSLQASYTNQDATGNSIYDFLSGNTIRNRLTATGQDPQPAFFSGPLLN